MSFKSKLSTALAAAIIGMALVGGTKANPITYAVSLFDNAPNRTEGVSIAGSITTDGTLGPLTAANILDWNLIGVRTFNPNSILNFNDFTGPISGNSSTISGFESISAAPNTLFLDPAPCSPIKCPPGSTATLDFLISHPLPFTIDFQKENFFDGTSSTEWTVCRVCTHIVN